MVFAYNIETILAEKLETILSRSVFNTRIRDYYDVYILSTTQTYDKALFKEALHATAAYRNSTDSITNAKMILENIKEHKDSKDMWIKYQNKFDYAKDISFEKLITALMALVLNE